LYNHYQCEDDQWIAIAHLDPDRYWPKVCKALDIENLQNDLKFNTIQARGRNAKELVAILDQRFITKPRDEWIQILKREGCIFTPIQTPLEVSNDMQAIANNYFINVQHPEWGRTKMVGFPWDFSETPASWRREAPAFGQHSEEVLSEVGYSNGDIASLKGEGVIQ
jgi:crotonobetainyl-CoA:carnitine CoA-transferase CaiB-like acyl-CoA transferase